MSTTADFRMRWVSRLAVGSRCDGVRKEDLFPISHVLALGDRAKPLERIRTATTAAQVSGELHRLALLFREHVTPLLLGGDGLFDEMSADNAARSTAYLE